MQFIHRRGRYLAMGFLTAVYTLLLVCRALLPLPLLGL